MIITRLEKIEKSKINVYIDDEYAFHLYQKDIDAFELKEGGEISFGSYEELLENTVLPRAQHKALTILKYTDRSEQELRRKLFEAGYPESIINQTLDYVKEYNYLNDERYASEYVRSRINNKSKLVIKMELLQKGVHKNTVDQILEREYKIENQEDPELVAIERAIAKKTKAPEHLTYEEKQKLIASLYRKGFDLNKVNQLLS